MTLHDAIVEILRELGHPVSTTELADEVNRRGSYRKKDRSPITAFQIHGRTRNYPQLFSRQTSNVSLAEWNGSIVEPDRVGIADTTQTVLRLKSAIEGILSELTTIPVLASAALPPHVPGFYAWWINDEKMTVATPGFHEFRKEVAGQRRRLKLDCGL